MNDAIANKIAFLISFQVVHCSGVEMQLIFVAKNFVEFVHWFLLLLCVDSLGFSTQKIMTFANRNNFIYSFLI